MKTIDSYLDELNNKFGSVNKTSEAVGVNRITIYAARKRKQIGDETAIKIAEALEIDKGEVLIAAAIARSEGETKREWIRILKKAGYASGIFVDLV